jgi:hypothetical protein
MKVADAQARIGKRVHILTFRGNYIATILSVDDSVRPFKALVRLDRISEWPGTDRSGFEEQLPYPRNYVRTVAAIEIANPYGGGWIREAYGATSWLGSVHLAHRRRLSLIDHETTPHRIKRVRDLYSFLAQICDAEVLALSGGTT